MNTTFCVYMHINKADNKRYIGITSQKPENRWRNGLGYKHNSFFFNAIQKYGWNNFEHKILYENLSKQEANIKEIELINQYQTADPTKGYNITLGGDGTLFYSTEEERIEAKRESHLKGALKRAADPVLANKDREYNREYSRERYLKVISDSALHEKHKEAMRGYSAKRYADPEGHEKMLETSRQSHARRRQDPEQRLKLNQCAAEIKRATYKIRKELMELFKQVPDLFSQTDIDYIFTKYETNKGYKYNSYKKLEKIMNKINQNISIDSEDTKIERTN